MFPGFLLANNGYTQMGICNVFADPTVFSINILTPLESNTVNTFRIYTPRFGCHAWVNTFSITMQISYKSKPFIIYKGKSCSKTWWYSISQQRYNLEVPILWFIMCIYLTWWTKIVQLGLFFCLNMFAVPALVMRLIYNVKEK